MGGCTGAPLLSHLLPADGGRPLPLPLLPSAAVTPGRGFPAVAARRSEGPAGSCPQPGLAGKPRAERSNAPSWAGTDRGVLRRAAAAAGAQRHEPAGAFGTALRGAAGREWGRDRGMERDRGRGGGDPSISVSRWAFREGARSGRSGPSPGRSRPLRGAPGLCAGGVSGTGGAAALALSVRSPGTRQGGGVVWAAWYPLQVFYPRAFAFLRWRGPGSPAPPCASPGVRPGRDGQRQAPGPSAGTPSRAGRFFHFSVACGRLGRRRGLVAVPGPGLLEVPTGVGAPGRAGCSHGTLGPALSPSLSAGAPSRAPGWPGQSAGICRTTGDARRGAGSMRGTGALFYPVLLESSFLASFLPFPVQVVPCQEEQGQALAKFAWVMCLTGVFLSLRDGVSALGRGWQCSGCESLVIAAPSVRDCSTVGRGTG